MARPLATAGFPVGINNTAPEERLPTNESGGRQALREAVNVDITSDGKPRRRDGYVQVQAGQMAHSAWSDDYLPWGLFVDGHNLYVMHEDESTDVLRSDMAIGLPVSYCRINDAVWWSNGVQSGLIRHDLEQLEWSAGQPPGAPAVSGQAGGMLPKGTYQVTATFLDATGRESGAPLAAITDVPDNGAINITQIPQPPLGGRTRLYVTEGQDGILRAAVTVPAGVTSYLLIEPAKGRTCDTLLLRPMPPGQLVAYGNARQFVARGRELLFSPTLRYGLFDPKAGRIGFNTRVQMIAFVGDGSEAAGLYLADAKRTYWFGGANPANWTQRIVHSSPALPGSLAWVPGEAFGLPVKGLLPCWHSQNGRLCIGLPGGEVFLPQPREGQPDAIWDSGDSAALGYIERPGDRRVVSSLAGASTTKFAVQDRLVVREYRHDR